MTTVLATGTELVFLFLALASTAASIALQASARKKGEFKLDTTTTTIASKGEFLQYVIGRRLVGPYFVWAGNRTVVQSGGGGGKGGSSAPGGNTYTESACHVLGLGPVDRLIQIRQEGKVIWAGDINRFTTPSGTRITISGEGSFEIYWGEIDQPVCAYLADASRIGVASSYPYHAYVVWIGKVLGSSARWPEIKYEVEATTFGSLMIQSTRTFSDKPGINPAHIFYQLATGKWPHGASMDPADIDFGQLEALGAAFQIEGLAFNMLINDGALAGDALAGVMQDAGFFLTQIGDQLVPIIVRVEASWPQFDTRHLTNPLPVVEISHGTSSVDRVVYAFADYTKNYTEATVQIDDDGEPTMLSNRKPSKVVLADIIDRATAVLVSDRRQSEKFIQGTKFQFNMMYSGRMLHPGMVFEIVGYGRMRVASRRANTDDGSIDILAMLDQFGAYSGFDPVAISSGSGGSGPALDRAFSLLELPYGWRNTEQALAVLLRIRDNPSVGGARVIISGDGNTYYPLGTQGSWCRGGTLIQDIAVDTGDFLEASVTIQQYNSDMSASLDLTSDLTSWLNGRQIAVIGKEIMFLQSVTSLGSGVWQLNGLLRNCLGSAREDHLAGDTVYIIEKANLAIFADPSFINGMTLFYKSQPVGISAEAITAQSVMINGYADAPYPCTAFFDYYYTTTGDLTLRFATRVRRGLGKAADEQAADVVVASTIPTTWYDGPIRVRILATDGTLKRTLADSTSTIVAATTNQLYVTYTAADRTTDFGTTLTDFRIEVASVLDEKLSPWQPFIVRAIV